MPRYASSRSSARSTGAGALEEALAAARADVERLLVDLCRSSSASGDRQGLSTTARLVASEIGGLGLEARIDNNLVVEVTSGDRPELFVVGHFDTVLDARDPSWIDERLLATGAVDMKGGIAAFLGALGVLRRLDAPIPEFRLALVPDEEIGGPLSADVVKRHGAKARDMWVLEPGQPTATGETMVLGRWGLATWGLDARGVAAHAGLDFASGRSALAAAARWVDRAQALGTVKDRSSLNCASFHSPGGDEPLNVVPDRASVKGEIRFADNNHGQLLLETLLKLTEAVSHDTGVALSFKMLDRVPAHDADDDATHLPRLHQLAAQSGFTLEVERSRRGVSFANFLPTDAGTRVLDGLGPVGGGMHTEDEWLSLESLHRRTQWLARMLLERQHSQSGSVSSI